MLQALPRPSRNRLVGRAAAWLSKSGFTPRVFDRVTSQEAFLEQLYGYFGGETAFWDVLATPDNKQAILVRSVQCDGDHEARRRLSEWWKTFSARAGAMGLIVVLQSVNPFHPNASVRASQLIDARADRLPTHGDVEPIPMAQDIWTELPDHCAFALREVVTSGSAAAHKACVDELVKAGVLRRDGALLCPVDPAWLPAWQGLVEDGR